MCYSFYGNGQCEKPQIVERVMIRIHTLFAYKPALTVSPKAFRLSPMKLNRIIALLWLAAFMLLFVCRASANDEVPCLIFTGNSETAHCIDLAVHNRITFSNDGMTVSSSMDDGTEELQLLYSHYHHIEIGETVPTGESAGIDRIASDTDSQLLINTDTKSLSVVSDSDLPFSIGIFNLNGNLLATSSLHGGQTLSLEALTAGAYIAVATDGTTKLTVKFILN